MQDPGDQPGERDHQRQRDVEVGQPGRRRVLQVDQRGEGVLQVRARRGVPDRERDDRHEPGDDRQPGQHDEGADHRPPPAGEPGLLEPVVGQPGGHDRLVTRARPRDGRATARDRGAPATRTAAG